MKLSKLIDGLSVTPELAIIDGNCNRGIENSRCIVKGDALSYNIAAASIIAKETRDRYMREIAKEYPEYGFEVHKGYGTKAHREALLSFAKECGVKIATENMWNWNRIMLIRRN